MKKISLIIPFMLLTPPLVSCNNYVDPFQINKDNFLNAVSFTAKDIKYVQQYRTHSIFSTAIITLSYKEDFISPSCTEQFEHDSQATPQVTPKDVYYSKEGNDFKKYIKEGTSGWLKTDADDDDKKYLKPTYLSIKSTLEDGFHVGYDDIKNKYDKERRGYYFQSVLGTNLYDVVLSFYNNRLTRFSFSCYKEYVTYFTVCVYEYGTITPVPPDVPNIQ